MKDQLINLKTAKLAKELGFNYPVLWMHHPSYGLYASGMHEDRGVGTNYNEGYAKGYYSAPTQSLLQKWLREKYGLFVLAKFGMQHGGWQASYCKTGWADYKSLSSLLDIYEEALEKGLFEVMLKERTLRIQLEKLENMKVKEEK